MTRNGGNCGDDRTQRGHRVHRWGASVTAGAVVVVLVSCSSAPTTTTTVAAAPTTTSAAPTAAKTEQTAPASGEVAPDVNTPEGLAAFIDTYKISGTTFEEVAKSFVDKKSAWLNTGLTIVPDLATVNFGAELPIIFSPRANQAELWFRTTSKTSIKT